MKRTIRCLKKLFWKNETEKRRMKERESDKERRAVDWGSHTIYITTYIIIKKKGVLWVKMFKHKNDKVPLVLVLEHTMSNKDRRHRNRVREKHIQFNK